MGPENYITLLQKCQETLDRLRSAKALYLNPLTPDIPLYDNVFLTGRPAVGSDGSVNIDITDDCPILMSPKLKQCFEAANIGINAISFDEIIDNQTFCRFSNGAFLSTNSEEDTQYIMQQRGVYMHDNPDKGAISTPAALNQPIGNSDGPIQDGIINEMQSEVQVFIQKEDGQGKFLPVRFVVPDTNNNDSNSKNDYTANTVERIRSFLQDPNAAINSKTIPNPKELLANMGDIIEIKLTHNPEDRSRIYAPYSISIDGKTVESLSGIHHFDTKSNIFEFNQSFTFSVPEGYKITHIVGCEPNPGRMAALFSDKALKKMSLAPRDVPEENLAVLQDSLGKGAAGLTRSPTGYFNNDVLDTQYDPELNGLSDITLSDALRKSGCIVILNRPLRSPSI